jgi:hypothetical protein
LLGISAQDIKKQFKRKTLDTSRIEYETLVKMSYSSVFALISLADKEFVHAWD